MHVRGYEEGVGRSRQVVVDDSAIGGGEDGCQSKLQHEILLRDAAEAFYNDLREMSRLSKIFGKGMDDELVGYDVLQPSRVADSIEI